MKPITNVFRITGFNALTATYRIADVVGMDREQSDYFRSADRLMSLSRVVRAPVSFLELRGSPVILYPATTAIPLELDLGPRLLTLRPRDESVTIDFSRSTEFDAIRLRVTRYAIEQHLRQLARLWQPSAGQAFFERKPSRVERNIGLYDGTRLRPLVLPDGGIGLCVDRTSRLISVRPMPLNLTKQSFESDWKGQRCVYRYGDSWYEIRCDLLARHPVSEFPVASARGRTNLLRYLLDTMPKPVPKHVANLDPSGSVVTYRNARGEERAAPSELCFPIQDTDAARRTALGRATIIEPPDRLAWSRGFVETHLSTLPVGGSVLHVTADPLPLPTTRVAVPDLLFGHQATLTAREPSGARRTLMKDFGPARLRLLQDPDVGPLTANKLDRQYLVLPESAAASFGPAFASHLRTAVDGLHPNGGYEPTIVTYDDTCRRTFVDQAKAVRAACDKIRKPGFAVVMIHRCNRRRRSEDALAAYVLRTFRDRCDTVASIVHYDSAERFYESARTAAGASTYRIRGDQRGRADGYLRNVALCKVLLAAQLWPFGLADPLIADLTIGIDVKSNTCCLVSVSERGARVASALYTSKQQEKLTTPQTHAYLTALIESEALVAAAPIRRIVLHRDGRAWPTEIAGARRALVELQSKGVLPSDASLTVLEIQKQSSVPLRIFAWDARAQRPTKPHVGESIIVSDQEAYVCTTGWPFVRPGTPKPLHVRRVSGPMSIEECVQDLFALSTLTWTRPEDCSRIPVTLRLADRFLAEEAAEYDDEEIAFGGSDLVEGEAS